MNEKEKKKQKETKKTKHTQTHTHTHTHTQTHTHTHTMKQGNIMIKDSLVTFLYMEKHAVCFEFLKRFIDIPFLKTVRRISF